MAMTSAPYNASRKSRTALSRASLPDLVLGRGQASSDDDAVTVECVHLDRNPVHRRQRLLSHDLVDSADAKSVFDNQRDTVHVVRDLVERVTDHEHREVHALVQLAN